MDYQLIRAYCAKDLNDILKPRDKWYSTPESRFEELECQILFKHRTGARCLEPRQYAAAVCLRAVELLEIPFEADDDCPEFTQADSVQTGRQILADSLAAYVLHLSESESRPLLLGTELAAFTASIAEPQQTAPAPNTATPTPVGAIGASDGVKPDKAGPVDKGWVMKKAALINKHIAQWPTINRDFQDASENDLSKAAKAPGHGEWYEAAALNWADQRGKRTKQEQQAPVNSVFNLAGTKHTTGG